MTEIGKMFGVSDNAVKKRCRKLGIELKPMRGFWRKLETGSLVNDVNPIENYNLIEPNRD